MPEEKINVLWAIPSFIIDFLELTYSEPTLMEADIYSIIYSPTYGGRPVPVFMEFGSGMGGELQVRRLDEFEPMRKGLAFLVVDIIKSGNDGLREDYAAIRPNAVPVMMIDNKVSTKPGAYQTILEQIISSISSCLDNDASIDRVLLTLSLLSEIEWGIREISQTLDYFYLFGETNTVESFIKLGKRLKVSLLDSYSNDGLESLVINIMNKLVELKKDIIGLDSESIKRRDSINNIDTIQRKFCEEIIKNAHEALKMIKERSSGTKQGGIDADKLAMSLGCIPSIAALIGTPGPGEPVKVWVFVPTLNTPALIDKVAVTLTNSVDGLSGAEIVFLYTKLSKNDAYALHNKVRERAKDAGIKVGMWDKGLDNYVSGEGMPKGERIAQELVRIVRSGSEHGVLVLVGEIPKDILIFLGTELAGDEELARRVLIAVPKRPILTQLMSKDSESGHSGGSTYRVGLFKVVRTEEDSDAVYIKDVVFRAGGVDAKNRHLFYCLAPLESVVR